MTDEPPFRIELVGDRFELVHVVAGHTYRYGLSHRNLVLLGRGVLDALGGVLVNTLVSAVPSIPCCPRKCTSACHPDDTDDRQPGV